MKSPHQNPSAARALLALLTAWPALSGQVGAASGAASGAAFGAASVATPHAVREPDVACAIDAPASVLLARSAGAGKVFLSTDEALALAFPKCEVKRETVYVTSAQEARARKLAGTELESAIARPWIARRDRKIVGTAYLDTHRVRALKETLFVVVDTAGRVMRTEVLAFAEPQEYLPSASWYEKLAGRPLDDELRVKRAIRPETGASLTVTATTEAVRRVLALHTVLGEPQPKR